MLNETIKRYAVIAVHKYDNIVNGYHSLKVFYAREHALDYLNAMNTASQYEEQDVTYILYVYEPEPNTK